MMTAGQLAETFERIRLGEHTPEDWVGLEDHIASRERQIAELTAALDLAKAAKSLAELHSIDLRTELSRRPPLKDDDWVEFWDLHGIQCGNCRAVMVSRGGMKVLSSGEGEDLAVCGHCCEFDLKKTEAELRESRSREAVILQQKDSIAQCWANEAMDLRVQVDKALKALEAACNWVESVHSALPDDLHKAGAMAICKDLSQACESITSEHAGKLAEAVQEVVAAWRSGVDKSMPHTPENVQRLRVSLNALATLVEGKR
jgi:hypothetical protein